MARSIDIEITDNMNDIIQGMPDIVAEMFLASLLDMACILVQTGDITIDIVGDKKFKVTARAKSGVRNLTVDLVSNS